MGTQFGVEIPTYNLNFGQALQALKAGKRVAREGWNGKGMWLSLSAEAGTKRSVIAESFWSFNNSHYAQSLGGKASVLPSITMKTADGDILMGWLASQTDMLAEDWTILPNWDHVSPVAEDGEVLRDKELFGAQEEAPKVTLEHIEDLITHERYEKYGTMTICLLTLRNGFLVSGESACASPENFDVAIGQRIARENAVRNIWPLEGYLLRERLYQAETEADYGVL
ncbi:MAG: Gp49 family protein [Pseudomonadota bacterium]